MTKSFNLANLSKEEMDKTNVDLAASGVAYKERMNQPVIADQVEREQPEHLREYYRERVAHYREVRKDYPPALLRFICKWLRPTARSNRTSIRTRYGGFFYARHNWRL